MNVNLENEKFINQMYKYRYKFRRKISSLLFILFFLFTISPVFLILNLPRPEGTTNGTIAAIALLAMLIGLWFWIIIYRNTRPKCEAYFHRKNWNGLFLISLVILLILAIIIGDYLNLAASEYKPMNWGRFWNDRVHTRHNFTIMELSTDIGQIINTIPFQIFTISIISLVSLYFRPIYFKPIKLIKVEPNSDDSTQNNSIQCKNNELLKQNKMILRLSAIATILFILLISIARLFKWGYYLPDSFDRPFLLIGTYDQQFSLLIIPRLLIPILGVFLYLWTRRFFHSNFLTKTLRRTLYSWLNWVILFIWLIINIIISLNKIYFELLFNALGIVYLIYGLLDILLIVGIILIIQSTSAKMGGYVPTKYKWMGRISSITFWLLIISYLAIILLSGVDMSLDLSKIISYFPNLLFSICATPFIYSLFE